MVSGVCPELVGRDEELAQLEHALQLALGGRGRVTFLSGEAGIGKSRLAHELMNRARADGVRVLSGRTAQTGTPIPYRPFAEALQAGLRSAAELDGPALDPYRAALRRLLPGAEPRTLPSEELPPLALMEGVLRLLGAMAEQADGLLLVLEDLHWADADTLALVEYLTDHLDGIRALCLCTERSDSTGPAAELVATLAARRSAERLVLSPLPDQQVETMVRLSLASDEVPPVLRTTLRERAVGVPFLVEETLSAYLAAGGPAARSPEWWISRRIAESLPPSYRELTTQRMALLDDDGRAVIAAAAVLGRNFEWKLLATITGLDQASVLASLRSAVEAGLVTGHGVHRIVEFEFRHALTRETVLAELLPPERSDLSLRAAMAIEATYPGLPGDWCQRAADLFQQGDEHLRACGLLQEAARRALLRSAFASAELILERARKLAGDDWMAWIGVEDLLLETLSLAGKTEQVLELGNRLVAVHEDRYRSLDRITLARLHLKIAQGVAQAGEWNVVGEHLTRARSHATDMKDASLLVHIDALAARLALAEGDQPGASKLAVSAARTAERLGLGDALCDALRVQARVAAMHGDAEAQGLALERCREAADRHRLPLWQARALLELGVVERVESGAFEQLLEARALAATAGAVSTLATIDLQLGWAHIDRAELEPAAHAIGSSLDLCRRHGLALLAPALTAQGSLYALAGERAELERVATEVLSTAHDSVAEAAVRGNVRAVLSLARGEEAVALEHLDAAVAAADAAPPEWNLSWLRGARLLLHSLHTTAALLLDESPQAAATPAAHAYRLYTRAVALGRAGRHEEAVGAVAEADSAMPLGWRRAHARLLVARAAFAEGWGEPASWIREALVFLDGASLVQFAAASKSILRGAGAPVPRRGRGESVVPPELREQGVTSREMDVVHLVAERLSNREIGERLFLSPRTVESHVTRLLRKLNLDERAELAALGRRHDVAASTDHGGAPTP